MRDPSIGDVMDVVDIADGGKMEHLSHKMEGFCVTRIILELLNFFTPLLKLSSPGY